MEERLDLVNPESNQQVEQLKGVIKAV
jgi:hypothetical protein